MSQKRNRRQLLKNTVAAIFTAGSLTKLNSKAMAQGTDTEFDILVVGSGAAGMTAALTAAKRGLRVLVVEKAAKFGGSFARSGGGIWIRNNSVILAAGVPDSPSKAASYLAKVVGKDVTPERQHAFLANGPAMLDLVIRNTPLRFQFMEGYSDYYPEFLGGLPNGASVEAQAINGKILGNELKNLNDPYIRIPPGIILYSNEYKWLTLAAVTVKGAATVAKAAARYAKGLLKGEKLYTMGQALAVGMRKGLLDAEVPVWLNTSLSDLQFDSSGRAVGILVKKNGQDLQLKAKHGVIIATGGFEHNLEMRKQYQAQPIGIDWTVGTKSNTGDGIQAGIRAGADLALMDDAWWGPSIPLPDQTYFCLPERTLAGSILVNGHGKRFTNEGAPYTDVVHAMYKDNDNPDVMSVWLITDQHYRNSYLFKDIPPTLPLPDDWYNAGVAHRAWTIEGLAESINVPGDALKETISRFNSFAETGEDLDFGRGNSAYDHYYTNPNVVPNSCLARLSLPPYYALKVVPGDLGTKGGLRTDANARVLRANGTVIEGLYAAGNASASVMGHSYAGNGATIGPAMTFGFIAANHIADNQLKD
ncbi:MAG: 3-oxosteroid 1-dehydrogenase [Chitinophagaceae bacterium]|nr:3-oxosteroid 1-dehydrogenase [Oligoflexus sp.]